MRQLYVNILIVITVILGISSCTDDRIDYSADLDYRLTNALSAGYNPGGDASFYLLPQSKDLASIPADPKNPLSYDKVQLGKFLFFETGFAMDSKHASSRQTYSCASCHLPEMGFRPNNVQGIADGGMGYAENRGMDPVYTEDELDVQEARPLNLINVAFVKNTSWNGQFGSGGANVGTEGVWDIREDTKRNSWGYEALETQNFAGILTHRFEFNKQLVERYSYDKLFDRSFPEVPEEDRYSNETAALAISAYLRTVLANKAPFQDWLAGDTGAMTEAEKEGALLFFGKANCSRCHYDKNLGSGEFHALGVKDMDQHPLSVKATPSARRNLGRGGFTLEQDKLYQFKVPGLYNTCDSDFYFHGSSAQTLEDVIDYKATALKENNRVPDGHMSNKFTPFELTEVEKENLLLFIRHSLRDPDLMRYQPRSILSGLCFPNNDEISQSELDCN